MQFLLGIYDSPHEFHKPRVVVEVRKLARMDKDEFSVVEDYLRRNQYSEGISKGDKANLRRKCKNFKFGCGVFYKPSVSGYI